MPKVLCAWKQKEIEANFDELTTIVGKSKFVCKKCARTAGDKKHLCKPEKIVTKKKKLHKKVNKSLDVPE